MSRIDRITLRQLRALAEVAGAESVVVAAGRLGLTGPAVHSQLRNLQDALGVPLLTRDGRAGARPTPEGAALLAAHARIRAALDRALHEIDDLRAGRTGSVVLGCVSTAKYFAPGIVARLSAAMPRIAVRLVVANRRETIDALARGDFDLCIMGRPPRAPLVEALPLGPHPHVLIAAADHPLAGQADLESRDIAGERFILREPGSGTRILSMRLLTDMIAEPGVEPVTMDSNETIKQAVMSGLGIAFISAHTVAQELHDRRLAVLDLKGTPVLRQWYLLVDDAPTPAALQVRDWLVAQGPAIFPALP